MSNQLAATGGSEGPNILAIIEKLSQSGVTPEGVAMMKQMVELHEHVEDRNAQKAFAAAFVKLQASISGVTANKIVPLKGGGVKYKYAPYEEVMDKVKPALAEHGFGVSFNTRFSGEGRDNKVISECTLTHEAGHSKTCEFPCRVGQGPVGANESQADGAASTYAQRFALCKMLNIVIETDDDAGAQDSKAISFDDATKLRERLIAAGGDEAAFLLHIKEESFGSIPATKLEFAEGCVRKKERATK